ncbi:protein DOWN-REGULATED IN DIF1 11-like [Rosa chinensis]|uniref:protein DOWN-REGULATED IN DIF1 11-like n=1 Tax=Rosa chinensis TaxID=74649 RepID=UPI000D08EAD5|nr:protein DOWN-REGULATED IN DIF1 11-like [Rosa chinensis]
MARVDQNVFVKVGLVLVSVALFMSSFAAAQEYEVIYQVSKDAAASPTSIEVDYLVIDVAFPPISSENGQYAFPPNASPESYMKLDECVNKITGYYAEEILPRIFKSEPLTTDSCKAILHLGYDCHIQSVKALLSRPELKEKASEILPKSVQIWETCAFVAPSPF